MQIHELTSFSGNPGPNDYLAIDNGSETTKVPATNLGITTPMTAEEARAGTSEEARVISAKVLNDQIDTSVITLYQSLGWTQEASI